MKKVFSILLLFSLLGLPLVQVNAQLPNVPIESLSDQQIIALMTQYQLFGLSELEMETRAREKGLTTDQINQLKKRMTMIDPITVAELNKGGNKASYDPYESRKATPIKAFRPRSFDTSILRPFGADLFETAMLSFEPELNIPTPVNYIIGVNDQLSIDLFGVSDLTRKLKVNTEGYIRFPNLGPIKVAGLTVDEARLKLKSALTKIYPGIANGSVGVQVSLAQLRTIKVTMIGEVIWPGNYELSSFATLMNALYVSGGPNKIGSFRDIELVRHGKTVVKFDLYDFLLKSDLTKNLILNDGDVIRINPYSNRIILKGAVKKPALFDVQPQESAADIIRYAGGFADIAYKEWIRVYRMGLRNKEIISVPQQQLSSFRLQTGDTLVVDSLANQYANRVTISGAVYYGGAYSLQQLPSLKDLLQTARLREDVFMNRGVIKRLKQDFTPEIIAFDINKVLRDEERILLQREDSVQVFRITDLREQYSITINGEVNKPGSYPYAENMGVQDLVLLAEGYRDGAALQNIEVSRRLRMPGVYQKDSAVYSMIKEINLANPSKADLEFKLLPFDIISVRKSPVYKEQITVSVEGEVVFPGKYTLSGNAERISDLIKRAGGLKQKGFAGGAMLLRNVYRDVSASDVTVLSSKNSLINTQSGKAAAGAVDSSLINTLNKQQKPVGIRLDQILNNPGSAEDLFLVEGDILKVPKELQTIQTFGAVNVPKQIVYYDGISFRDALRESGRYSLNASRKNAYVIYPNGQVRKTRNFLFLRFYPSIKPGTEIYVPEKRAKVKLSTGEVIGIVTGLTSLISVLVVLTNATK